ncbi:hypothetical protein [Arcanobacterium phocae]|uniref:hypothetical protein n=1 Tax=Arcanobacterium phocae TaxID=131112 RepID=UPI001C0E9D1E|nr:hypothetical protein [Arcanobacterium phocae]
MKTLPILAIVGTMGLGLSSCSSDTSDPKPTPATSDAAINNTHYQCLLDAGVPATISNDGIVSYRAETEEQEKLYASAAYSCESKIEENSPQVATAKDDLGTLYERMTAVQECLAAKGIPVDEWPSRETFIENEGNYSVPMTLEPLTWEQTTELCPSEAAQLHK